MEVVYKLLVIIGFYFRCEVSSDKLQGITSNVENIIEIMRQYLNNEDVIAAVLGLLDALISAGLLVDISGLLFFNQSILRL